MNSRRLLKASGIVSLAISLGCHALQVPSLSLLGGPRPSRSRRPLWSTTRSEQSNNGGAGSDELMEDDETLLASIDPSTLQTLCAQYSLSTSGTKQEMLDRLRAFAAEQAELDRRRRAGRTTRVEANLEGKARHTILDHDAILPDAEVDEGDEDTQGFFYYAATETEQEKQQREVERRKRKQTALAKARESQSRLTAPPPPEDIEPNEKGERVVTVYSTTDKNDLTSMTSQTPLADMSLENARYQQKTLREDRPEDSLVGGPFGDTTGARRRKADDSQVEAAKDEVRELVRNLLATTAAPAFQDDYEEGDDTQTMDSFASPYGFIGFQPERIPPDLLSQSAAALRAGNGRALQEVLSEYELQAIGHDGMAADDASQGGGHYREVEKVGSFLEGYRKAEERRVARETSTMLLDRLVKEGVKGLDQLLAGMVREGDEQSVAAGGEAGELNGALVRYLEEAIREQEQRVKRAASAKGQSKVQPELSTGEDEVDLMWNVTRGDDGTVIETIDPNNPAVGKMLREELEKMNNDANVQIENALLSMTVQEKMLLLLKLLRDRVKVEAVIGNDAHARNLRLLAYCLKAANDEERQQLVLDELGNSLDALDVFADLVTASIDYAEARSSDEFMPGKGQKAVSPMLDVAKLQKVRVVVERVKAKQFGKASGASQ